MNITYLDVKLYCGQTGRFPVTSNRVKGYVVIFYAVGRNYIKSYPIKSLQYREILKLYEEVYSYLRVRGYSPQLQNMYK